MGASNVMAAYAAWAGKIPPLSMQVLVYMAVVSRDDDRHPWYGQGHEALAHFAMGRPAPVTQSDIRAVERAITPLRKIGAIVTDRKASVRRDGPSTARYRLILDPRDVPRIPSGVNGSKPVDNSAQDSQRPTECGTHARRNPDSRPTECGTHARRNPWDRGTTRNQEEREEEEEKDLRTEVAVSRARDREQDPIFLAPDPEPTAVAPPGGTAPPAARPGRARADPPAAVTPIGALLEPAPPTRPACPTGLGWCVTCYATGQYTTASDPTASYCAHHHRTRREAHV